MRIPRQIRLAVITLLTILLSHLPNVAVAAVSTMSTVATLTPVTPDQYEAGKMVATNVVIADLTRAQAQEKIQTLLKQSELRQKLTEKGISADEVSSRLAGLSDSEMKQLAQQMDSARYGGDILVAILIIVLIIFLIKRI